MGPLVRYERKSKAYQVYNLDGPAEGHIIISPNPRIIEEEIIENIQTNYPSPNAVFHISYESPSEAPPREEESNEEIPSEFTAGIPNDPLTVQEAFSCPKCLAWKQTLEGRWVVC
mmetsp:Transcript_891/g.1222  ORF Transcript_891/g.1222 Transcript_891/m.1222 type:complete len:115 (-) Transcript_891:2009-2353(-)